MKDRKVSTIAAQANALVQSNVIEALSNVFAVALRSNALADATEIVDTLAALGPADVEWDSFYATIQMQAGNYPEAVRLFRNCPVLLEKWSWGRAAMACCLFEMKDEEWRMQARLVLENDSPDAAAARQLAGGLFARFGEHLPGMSSDDTASTGADAESAIADRIEAMPSNFVRA